MTMKTLLTAAAALALIGGAAHAGEGAKKSKPADSAQMQDETGKAMTTPGADASATTAMPGAAPDPQVPPELDPHWKQPPTRGAAE